MADSNDMLDAIVQQILSGQGRQSNPISDVGTVLGNAAAGRAAGVNQQNATALGAGDLSNRLFQSSMNRDLAQAALPNFRAQQAVTGDQIANTQDVVPTGPANVMAHVVNFTGGRRPSNLGPAARGAGAALANIGASNIGKDVLPAVPTMPKMSDGGVLGNILGGGALGASLLGALMGKGGPGSGGQFDIGKLLGGLKDSYDNREGGPNQAFPYIPDGSEGDVPTGPSNVPFGPTDPQQAYLDWLESQGMGPSQRGGSDPSFDWGIFE